MDSNWLDTQLNPGTQEGALSKDFGAVSQMDRTRGSVPSVAWHRLQIVRVAKIILAVWLLKAMIRKWETRDAAFIPNDLENAIS